MENLGKRSICTACDRPIYHNGKYWDHVDGHPRHPANPIDEERLRAEIAELEFKLTTKKYMLQHITSEPRLP